MTLDRNVLFLAFLVAPASRGVGATPETPPRDPGIDVAHYAFRLDLEDQDDVIEGEASITVRFIEAGVCDFALDLVGTREGDSGMTVTSVTRGGTPLEYGHEGDRLRIHLEAPTAAEDRQTFLVAYHGTPGDGLVIDENRHGERTFFADNWPDRARHWLPCVDHVADKATVEFVVIAPDRYQVVSNGRLVEETDLAGERRQTHWRSDHPLPTKVMVIGVARFAVEHLGEVAGVPLQSWVYPQDRDAGFHDYALAGRVLPVFVERLGPFPYAKLANVQSRTRYGGMENAGAIFYGEGSVTGTGAIEGLVAHEIAHQWFGDSVTEGDWRHIWLSEGFATYLAALYMEITHGRARLVEDMRSASHQVFRFAARHPDLAVVGPENADPNTLLNANAYQKGAWVLHMLRREVGDEAFWNGLRLYYETYRDANAVTADFRRVMEKTAGRPLDWFFAQWLEEPRHPRIRGEWTWGAAAGRLVMTVRQEQESAAPYRLSLDLAILDAEGGTLSRETLGLTGLEHEFVFELDRAPAKLVLDPDVWVLMDALLERR